MRDADNPHGDIEIVEIGLRDGEKLYEELLIGKSPQPTAHERIIRAHEEMLSWADLKPQLDRMMQLAVVGDRQAMVSLLHQLVPGISAPRNAARPAAVMLSALF